MKTHKLIQIQLRCWSTLIAELPRVIIIDSVKVQKCKNKKVQKSEKAKNLKKRKKLLLQKSE
jgi:hypothetical protein